jgi:TonB family protein
MAMIPVTRRTMMRARMRVAVPFVVASAVLWLCATPLVVHVSAQQDALAKAKDLYASAEYEEALTTLNQMQNASQIEVDQYRALCLFALGRTEDARQVIQRIVEKDPSFEPAENQVSPKVREAFREVRRRALPSIVKQEYADAKTTFESGDVASARLRFERVVSHVDALEALGSKDLGDLRVLSSGFLDLIAQAAKVSAAQAAAAAAAAAAKAAEKPAPPPPPAIYTAADVGVTQPVTISQQMPPWRPARQGSPTYEAVLTVLIDETGAVTEVNIFGSLQPNYDASLRRAAMTWRFQPATRRGVPVKYRKNIAVRLTGDTP